MIHAEGEKYTASTLPEAVPTLAHQSQAIRLRWLQTLMQGQQTCIDSVLALPINWLDSLLSGQREATPSEALIDAHSTLFI